MNTKGDSRFWKVTALKRYEEEFNVGKDDFNRYSFE